MSWFVLGFWASYIPVLRGGLLFSFLSPKAKPSKSLVSFGLSLPPSLHESQQRTGATLSAGLAVIPELLTWKQALQLG